MKRQPRFEIVRSHAGWFGRYIAANGLEVWQTSEVYTRRRAVSNAVAMLTEVEVDTRGYVVRAFFAGYDREVRYVDER